MSEHQEKKSVITSGETGSAPSAHWTVHSNIDQQVLQITEDRLRLILRKLTDHFNSASEWVTYASLAATFFIVLITSDFKDALGLSKDSWTAVFVILTGLFTFLTVVAVVRRLKTEAVSIDTCIDEIKAASKKDNSHK